MRWRVTRLLTPVAEGRLTNAAQPDGATCFLSCTRVAPWVFVDLVCVSVPFCFALFFVCVCVCAWPFIR